jgi:predicted metal-binding membrane protein
VSGVLGLPEMVPFIPSTPVGIVVIVWVAAVVVVVVVEYGRMLSEVSNSILAAASRQFVEQ